MIRIFHTGDIHLGMKFSSYPDLVRERLVEARFSSLDEMINKANDLNCDIFVVAGDLFNTLKVSKSEIDRAVKIMEKFNGKKVLLLPGNHDYDNGIVELWRIIDNYHSENIIILNEMKEYDLREYDLDLIVYPAYCYNKHSKENNLEWIKHTELREEDNIKKIGVAHGAIEGLSADIEGNYYPMSINELESIEMDLWLLGHTHVRYPYKNEVTNNKVFNAGTHEPDGLNYKDRGSAWYIELTEEVKAKRIITGKYKFEDKYFDINSDQDLKDIVENINADLENLVLRLNLQGNISRELYSELNMIYKSLDEKVFTLIIEDSNLKEKIDMELIKKEFTEDSFPYKFLENLSEDEDALQIAYELIRRR